jgi:predicted nucleic acid-binding protein
LLVVDTNVLLAAADNADPDHDRSVKALGRETPLATTALVIAETAYLIGRQLGAAAEAAFFGSVAAGDLQVEALTPADAGRIAELIEKYADLGLGGTDASLIAVAERLGVIRIATLDRRHFGTVQSEPCPCVRARPVRDTRPPARLNHGCARERETGRSAEPLDTRRPYEHAVLGVGWPSRPQSQGGSAVRVHERGHDQPAVGQRSRRLASLHHSPVFERCSTRAVALITTFVLLSGLFCVLDVRSHGPVRRKATSTSAPATAVSPAPSTPSMRGSTGSASSPASDSTKHSARCPLGLGLSLPLRIVKLQRKT